jgi:hypothetical protein
MHLHIESEPAQSGPPAAADRPLIFALAAALLLAVLFRLPQLLSPQLLMDPDEAVIGVMARLLADGEQLPIFMLGRGHGLSMLEAALTASSITIFGATPLAIKLAMLALWLVGLIFFVLAIKELFCPRLAVLIAPLLALAPGWAVWSMKARGGYITAFVFSNIGLWLIGKIRKRALPNPLVMGAVGVSVGVTYLAQPFFAIAMLPFLLLLSNAKLRGWVAAGAGAAGVVILLRVLARDAFVGKVPGGMRFDRMLDDLVHLPERVWLALSGGYYYYLTILPGFWTIVAATLWTILLTALGVSALVNLQINRKWTVRHASLAALTAMFAVVFIVDTPTSGFPYRYLLPLTGITLLLAGTELAERTQQWRGRTFILAYAMLIGTSAAATLEFGRVSMAGRPWLRGGAGRAPEVAEVREMIRLLQGSSVRHIYTLDAGLQWTTMYLSNGAITARSVRIFDRHPPFPRTVDAALYSNQPVALVAYREDFEQALEEHPDVARLAGRPRSVGLRFIVLVDPSPDLLKGLGFRLTPPQARTHMERPAAEGNGVGSLRGRHTSRLAGELRLPILPWPSLTFERHSRSTSPGLVLAESTSRWPSRPVHSPNFEKP